MACPPATPGPPPGRLEGPTRPGLATVVAVAVLLGASHGAHAQADPACYVVNQWLKRFGQPTHRLPCTGPGASPQPREPPPAAGARAAAPAA